LLAGSCPRRAARKKVDTQRPLAATWSETNPPAATSRRYARASSGIPDRIRSSEGEQVAIVRTLLALRLPPPRLHERHLENVRCVSSAYRTCYEPGGGTASGSTGRRALVCVARCCAVLCSSTSSLTRASRTCLAQTGANWRRMGGARASDRSLRLSVRLSVSLARLPTPTAATAKLQLARHAHAARIRDVVVRALRLRRPLRGVGACRSGPSLARLDRPLMDCSAATNIRARVRQRAAPDVTDRLAQSATPMISTARPIRCVDASSRAR